MSALQDLRDAQFLLKELYVDFIWQERVKAYPTIPSKMRVPFKWQASAKVIDIKSKRKK